MNIRIDYSFDKPYVCSESDFLKFYEFRHRKELAERIAMNVCLDNQKRLNEYRTY